MDILLDTLLKPPQPFIGLFFYLFLNVNFHFEDIDEVLDWNNVLPATQLIYFSPAMS